MRIGELARAAGVIISTARFFERHGVFVATSRPSDGANYDLEALSRLRFALRVRACGLDMKAVVAAVHAFDVEPQRRPTLLAPVLAEIDGRQTQLARLRGTLDAATASRASLQEVTALLDA